MSPVALIVGAVVLTALYGTINDPARPRRPLRDRGRVFARTGPAGGALAARTMRTRRARPTRAALGRGARAALWPAPRPSHPSTPGGTRVPLTKARAPRARRMPLPRTPAPKATAGGLAGAPGAIAAAGDELAAWGLPEEGLVDLGQDWDALAAGLARLADGADSYVDDVQDETGLDPRLVLSHLREAVDALHDAAEAVREAERQRQIHYAPHEEAAGAPVAQPRGSFVFPGGEK